MRRLLIRPGAIGDVIASLPALEFLAHGADECEVWAPAALVPLMRFGARRVRAISATGLDLLELGRAPESVWQTLGEFDDIVSWYGASRAEFRAAVRGLPFRFFPALPGRDVHATDFYLQQAGAAPGGTPRIAARECARREEAALHPLSGSARKNWPRERFEELARRDARFVWCHERFEDLGELADWLAGARVFVGNDSGITHLAAAVGVPTIALFGPASDPAVWAPRRARVIRGKTIDAITVDQVHRTVIDLLG